MFFSKYRCKKVHNGYSMLCVLNALQPMFAFEPLSASHDFDEGSYSVVSSKSIRKTDSEEDSDGFVHESEEIRVIVL